MGPCSCSRRYLAESCSLLNQAVLHKKFFVRSYYTAASAMLLEIEAYIDDRLKVSRNRSCLQKRYGLFPLVGRVFKSLDWVFSREIRFATAVRNYGFSHSIDAFGILVHVFALAVMRMEVHALLRDIVGYSNKANYDAFDLLPTLLDSSKHVVKSIVVFDVLIKVFAANSMLENAVDVFVWAKSIGLKPDILSCNFLLKCLVEANKGQFVTSSFEDLKNTGLSPNTYSYTIMVSFYCKGHLGGDMDIEQATQILEEMNRTGENPTVVTHGTYINGLCKVVLSSWPTIIF